MFQVTSVRSTFGNAPFLFLEVYRRTNVPCSHLALGLGYV